MFLTLILVVVKEKSASCFCWLKMCIHNLFILKNQQDYHAHVHKLCITSKSKFYSFIQAHASPILEMYLNNYHLGNSVPPNQTECGNRLWIDLKVISIYLILMQIKWESCIDTFDIMSRYFKLPTTYYQFGKTFLFGLLLNLSGSCVTNEFLSDLCAIICWPVATTFYQPISDLLS